jgi:hypothetical protein
VTVCCYGSQNSKENNSKSNLWSDVLHTLEYVIKIMI